MYVACGGNNAIAVVERHESDWKLEGSVPAGWFPSAIALDQDGALRVVNIKGTGNTATGVTPGHFRSTAANDSGATTCSNRIRYAGGSGREQPEV